MCNFISLKSSLSHVKQVARGGQKIVYQAVHENYGQVVVKLFFKIDERSEREINIGKTMKFDCVPTIYEIGYTIYEGTNTLYVIEEQIKGEELREKLLQEKFFSLKEAIDFLEQGLLFIKQLEKNNIVHRDIKPENIIISPTGKVFFLDFGIARILDLPSLTETSAILGPHTAGYAAPEQFNNQKDNIDSRADLFSIGVVTYECLSGKNPFNEDAATQLDILQRTETITPLTFQIIGDTQQQFMRLLRSLMGRFPSQRPKDAEQALNWLYAAKATLSL